MALIKCSECGKEISDKSKVCIHCGNKIKKNKKKINENLLIIIIVVAVLLVLSIIIAVITSIKNKPDLKEVFEKVDCDDYYCELADDESYLQIDTNPLDIDDYTSSIAWEYVEDVNKELGFTDALFQRMGQTRALDGTMQEENKDIKVSWTYHPDNGFEVTYSLK